MKGERNIPSDLLGVICLVLLTDIFILVPALSETAIRTVLGLPMVLFLPGYALIAALFPAKKDLDGIERVALSFGLSIAVVPLIGLGLNYTPWGIRLLPILASLSVFTLVMCGIAIWRRNAEDEKEDSEAFDVPFRQGLTDLKAEVFEKPQSGLDTFLTIILVLSILASVLTLVYVVVTPKEGEHFTEFYILGPEGMADNYPTHYALGDTGTVIVGVVNHEYRALNYSMDIKLDGVSLSLPDDREHINLGHNETWERSVNITPPFEGTDMKLEFLLFNDTVKTEPYRDLHLWVNVTEEEAD